jgi:hypothetical protein
VDSWIAIPKIKNVKKIKTDLDRCWWFGYKQRSTSIPRRHEKEIHFSICFFLSAGHNDPSLRSRCLMRFDGVASCAWRVGGDGCRPETRFVPESLSIPRTCCMVRAGIRQVARKILN